MMRRGRPSCMNRRLFHRKGLSSSIPLTRETLLGANIPSVHYTFDGSSGFCGDGGKASWIYELLKERFEVLSL